MIDVDILPASSEKSGGDSVLIRIGTFDYSSSKNDQKVILIDGGYQENADRIFDHLKYNYQTDTIDLAIITHPDHDHISGFKKLLDNGLVKVKKTMIHDPWNHAQHIFKKTQDGRRTVTSISNKFEETLKCLSDTLDDIGGKNTEPFGYKFLEEYGIHILGPSKEYYRDLLYQFPSMEGENSGGSSFGSDVYEEGKSSYNENVRHFLDNPHTSPKNSTSTIILLSDEKNKPFALFTGDAGVEAIEKALDAADNEGIEYKGVNLFQIPHHGSIKNLSEKIINRISPKRAYVSAPHNSEKHPSKLLINFFIKKEISTHHVSVNTLLYRNHDVNRPEWGPAEPAKISYFVKLLRMFWR